MAVEVPYKGYTFILDEEDVHYISDYNWGLAIHKRKAGDLVYLVHKTHKNNQYKYLRLHRLIMGLPPSNESDLYVDHINHNTLDNRKENLRVTTKKENSRNGTLRPNNVSGYTGVTYNANSRRNKKYVAWICVDYKNIYLGTHTTAERAAHAYDWNAIKYFGKYASLNFPDYDYVNCDPYSFLSNEKILSKHNTSGEEGVGFDKDCNRWSVCMPMYVNGVRKRKRIGRYATKELAIEAKYKWLEEQMEDNDE